MHVILGSWGRKVQNLRPAWAICSETHCLVWSLNPVSKAAHTEQCVSPWAGCLSCRAGHGSALVLPALWCCFLLMPLPPVLRVWVSPWISPLVKEKGVTVCSQPPLLLPELVLWLQGLRGPSQTDVLSCCLSWGNLGLTVWGNKHYRFLLTWNLASF